MKQKNSAKKSPKTVTIQEAHEEESIASPPFEQPQIDNEGTLEDLFNDPMFLDSEANMHNLEPALPQTKPAESKVKQEVMSPLPIG